MEIKKPKLKYFIISQNNPKIERKKDYQKKGFLGTCLVIQAFPVYAKNDQIETSLFKNT